MNKRLLVALIALGALTFASCKKNQCKDEWPEGFEFYETTSGKDEASCFTPLLKGKYKHDPNGQHFGYQMELTPQQGVADFQINAGETGHFQAPRSYVLNTGNVSDESHQLHVSVNTQWVDQVNTHYYAPSGSCNLEKVDTVAGTVSLTLEYEIAPAGREAEKKAYRVELEDYPMPWNPY